MNLDQLIFTWKGRHLVLALFASKAYYIITSKADVTKENANIEQVLREEEYQKIIISKIFMIITNNQTVSVTKTNTSLNNPRR